MVHATSMDLRAISILLVGFVAPVTDSIGVSTHPTLPSKGNFCSHDRFFPDYDLDSSCDQWCSQKFFDGGTQVKDTSGSIQFGSIALGLRSIYLILFGFRFLLEKNISYYVYSRQ